MALYLKKLGDMVKLTGVKGYLHKNLPKVESHRGYDPLHASDLTKQEREFCPREAALMLKYEGKHAHEVVKTSMSYTFMIGRIIERELRQVWLRDISWGDWECDVCGEKLTFEPSQPCPLCGADPDYMSYQEVGIQVPELHVVCSPDDLVQLPGRKKLTLLEIKSMDKDHFKKLAAPIAEHRLRTNLYLRLISLSEQSFTEKIDVERASILYVSKGFGIKDPSIGPIDGGFSPFKEFDIWRDDDGCEIEYQKLMALAASRKAKFEKLPGRICSMPIDKRAKFCPALGRCFIEA